MRLLTALTAGMLSVALAGPAHAATHLMRFADIDHDKVVFTYEGDLWLASTAGGEAQRITRDPGEETNAKFSPDGSMLAFTANYDGGSDVYVMDARGGVPRRLTWHPATDNVLDWFPDGKSILFRSRRNAPFAHQLYRVPLDGGTEQLLPVDRAGLTALSPDGKSIAYDRLSREFATWKRYQGGEAQSIWMGSLEKGDFHEITNWAGSNAWPMWQGDGIYFVSDRQFGTMNLYRYDVRTAATTALTQFRDYDVKYPSIGPGAIVFQHAEALYTIDLAHPAAPPRRLEITIPTDLDLMRPWYVDVADNQGAFGLSPGGARMLLEVRGEVLTVPVEKSKGEPLNLTQASGSREKNPAWSPDGKSIAFLSDRSGEEEVWLASARGDGAWKQLTHGNKGFRTQLVWSPDGKWLLFSDKFMRLNLTDAKTGAIQTIAQGRVDDGWERWGIQDYVWAPDSKWIAYTRMNENLNETIQLYSLGSKTTITVTDDAFTSWSPSFAPGGRYLFFLSNRTFTPIMGTIDQNHVFLDMARPYAVVLEAGSPSPFAPQDAEDGAGEDAKKDTNSKSSGGVAVRIETAGLASRVVGVPGIEAGDYFRLEATDKGFLYLAEPKKHFDRYKVVTDLTEGELDLYHYSLEPDEDGERKPEKLLSGIANYHLSADGKRMVYRYGNDYGVLDTGKAAKDEKAGDGAVSLAGVKVKIDRRQEYLQIFNEAWRVERDWFYDPNMHGVDWDSVGAMYRKFVPDCGKHSDLVYLIGEMIAELNAGHTYSYGGDDQAAPRKSGVGMLGVDFDAPPGSPYPRIARIVQGDPWSDDESSPLQAPGCPIRAGDYLLEVDHQEVRASDNVYSAFDGKAGHVVTLTFNHQPTRTGASTYRVRTIASESDPRYREWVEGRRAYVDRASHGTIGYIYLPAMGEDGLIEFARAYHPQHTKQAMIIDDRYNGGGFTADMIIDRMERKLWAMTKPREGAIGRNPEGVFHGHYAVIINEETGSNGEYFARAIQLKGLAKVFGMRTWGGAVGIEVHQMLVDGGTCTPPQYGAYELSGQWVIEGRGAEPDVAVQNEPNDVLRGKDAQLDAAIEYLKQKMIAEPMALPPPPPYPVKAK